MPAYDKSDLERRMHGAVESLKGDLSGLRTGRASVNLLEPVTVEVYGAHMPLNQVATVSVPEPRMLNTTIGILLSRHSATADASITLRSSART